MTSVRQVIFRAPLWMPRAEMAAMPISVEISGRGEDLVYDLSKYLESQLSWGVYGETVVPLDTIPRETLGESAQTKPGAVLIAVDENQPAPEYVDTNEAPDTSTIFLRLEQPLSKELEDRNVLIDHRKDVFDALVTLTGDIDGD